MLRDLVLIGGGLGLGALGGSIATLLRLNYWRNEHRRRQYRRDLGHGRDLGQSRRSAYRISGSEGEWEGRGGSLR